MIVTNLHIVETARSLLYQVENGELGKIASITLDFKLAFNYLIANYFKCSHLYADNEDILTVDIV